MPSVKTGIEAHALSVWEDVLEDYLEVACRLDQKERQPLIEALRFRRIRAKAVQQHSCVSLNGRMIALCEGIRVRELWLYAPANGRLRIVPLR